MASSEQQTLDELDACPECGESAMSSDTPCSRCQPPQPTDEADAEDDDGDGEEIGDDRCQNCGSHVSEAFRRVCGDNDNVAHACAKCSPRNGNFPHKVAGLDTEGIPVVQR